MLQPKLNSLGSNQCVEIHGAPLLDISCTPNAIDAPNPIPTRTSHRKALLCMPSFRFCGFKCCTQKIPCIDQMHETPARTFCWTRAVLAEMLQTNFDDPVLGDVRHST